MTPAISSSDSDTWPDVIQTWLRAGLAATLLMALACKEPARGASAAERLKAEATLVESARLVSCQGDKELARMPEPLLAQLRTALPRATVSRDPALTTPPWESILLELKLRDGQAVFGQLVREDVLRLREERWCGGGTQGVELLLTDGPSLLPWFQQHLGPAPSKEHQLPPGPPPPP
ncbi:hypothetical protein [Corallococcus sp. AS-1-12]|uniref:hypothetical protein n=1 Tax=Corallococcus sp. AS-1-12 TaxID=2874598 RepID=UPI001CBE9B70|nr:hypothetical protein [Corallococcus sp. AS-1-12]MBZ4330228.1 hypothetical protein [Corallococcus sp. AS-1-12]